MEFTHTIPASSAMGAITISTSTWREVVLRQEGEPSGILVKREAVPLLLRHLQAFVDATTHDAGYHNHTAFLSGACTCYVDDRGCPWARADFLAELALKDPKREQKAERLFWLVPLGGCCPNAVVQEDPAFFDDEDSEDEDDDDWIKVHY